VVYIVWDKDTCYYLLGGYDPERSHSGASALAMWEAIKYAKNELKLSKFDFEGSMVPAIEMFFRKFGGEITPYYSVQWIKPSSRPLIQFRKLIGNTLKSLNFK
jgi:lipid II:glycine glycyltransferase (peptidoglycan interpeptide bridge formation enzyme)